MTGEEDHGQGVRQDLQLPPGPAHESGQGQPRATELADLARLVWRRKAFIAGGTVLCGIAALAVSLTATRVYEARATLIVQPTLIPEELKPAPLSVETYRALLESDFIVDQSRTEMIGRGIVPRDTPIEAVREMLHVETFKDTRDIPLLALRASADSGEKASAAANTWAEVFLRESEKLARQGQEGSIRTVEAQHPAAQNSLAEAEAELKDRQDSFERTMLETEKSWQRRLSEFSKETDNLRNEHEKETARLRLEFETLWKPDLMLKRLAAREQGLLDLENGLLNAQAGIKIKQDTLAKIREELKSEPRYVVLSKAITDEALWERIGTPGTNLPEALNQLRLRSELLNPVHQDLLARLTAAQLEYDELDRKVARLPGEIERLRRETDELRELAGAKQNELAAFLNDRRLALNNLQTDRNSGLTILQKTFEKEVAQLQRDRDFELEALKRKVQAARTAYVSLAARNQTAQLARMQEDAPLRLGASAVAPSRPTRPRTMLNVTTALAVGLVLSVLLAFLVEHVQTTLAAQTWRSSGPRLHSGDRPSISEPAARRRDD